MSSNETAEYSAKKTFVRLMKIGRPYIGWYVLICVIVAVLSITGVLNAEALRRVINAATEKKISLLYEAVFLGLAVVLIDVVGNLAKTYLSGMLEFKSTARLQAAVLDKLMRVQLIKLDKYHSADLINRINDSASAAQAGVNARAIDVISALLQIIFMLAYLLALNYMLTIGTLAIAALTPLVALPFTRKLRKLYETRQKAQSEREACVQEAVQGAEVVKTFSLAQKMGKLFMDRFAAYMRIHRKVLLFEAIGYHIGNIVVLGGLLYVLGFGGWLVVHGRLDVGAVAAFLISFERISNPVTQLSGQWLQLQSAMGQANRMFEVFDLPEDGTDTQEDREKIHYGKLEFDSVRFQYDEGDEVLKGISFTAVPGMTTAIAGPSGSGKSTIVSLLMRMYDPVDGVIRCEGMPIDGIHPKHWREGIAYVSQEPYLFSGTLYENIAFGRKDASAAEVREAARLAGIDDFIMSTQDGYETRIGERGLTLSGGERQRMSIARAFLRKPQLLVLDEPTSALDSRNEEIVQAALERLMAGRTTVVIAHRLSTIKDADRIVFLENGLVTEMGTHDELMDLRGHYFAMFESYLAVENGEIMAKGDAER